MRKFIVYAIIVIVALCLLVSIVDAAKERKYAGRRDASAKKSSSAGGQQKRTVEMDVSGNVADGLDDDEDDTPAPPTPSTNNKQFSSNSYDDDEEEEEDEDNDDDSSSTAEDSPIEDYSPPTPSVPDAFTIDSDGNRVYNWMNTEKTTALWRSISSGDMASLESIIAEDGDAIHHRSEDGRGALFWAYEFDQNDMVHYLLEKGADEEAVDANGETPKQLKGRAKQ